MILCYVEEISVWKCGAHRGGRGGSLESSSLRCVRSTVSTSSPPKQESYESPVIKVSGTKVRLSSRGGPYELHTLNSTPSLDGNLNKP